MGAVAPGPEFVVVANYRGPEFFREFADRWDVQFFDRVESVVIESLPTDFAFTSEDLSRMKRLETIYFNKWFAFSDEQFEQSIEDAIPSCKLVSVEKYTHDGLLITAKVDSYLKCCSSQESN